MIKRTVLFLLFLFAISFVSPSGLEAVESFHINGILFGANSSQKTLYIDQGESQNISFVWDGKSRFLSYDKKKVSPSVFIREYKGLYVGLECVETSRGLLILEAIGLKMES